MTPQTTIRGPWPKKPISFVISPKPVAHGKGKSKYGHLFERLAEGDSITCRPTQCRAMSNALNGWLKSNGNAHLYRAAYNTDDDGVGRVTLVRRESA